MTTRRAHRLDPRQADLFADARELYPVTAPTGTVTASDFRLRIAQAISEALHECGKSRARVALEMSEILGEQFSEHMLNAYASAAREGHDITVTRLRALVQVTGLLWLWSVATEGQGVTIMASEDAIYAQRGLLLKQIEELRLRERELGQLAPQRPKTMAIKRGGRAR